MARPLIKVCGMTRMEDVQLCADLGVDLIGFIFHPKSPRNADPDFVASVHTGITKVGVFVNQTADEIIEIMDRCRLHAAQLHGGQDYDACEKIGPDRVIRVFWPQAYASPGALRRDLDRYAEVCGHFLLDAGDTGQGGTGESFDFAMLQHIEIQTPWFLAGGLGPHNLDAALAVNPSGLDFNSGVESAPGIKDATRLRAVLDRIAALE